VSGDLRRLVDPGGGRQLGRDGRSTDEPFGVLGVGGVEHDGPGGMQVLGVAVVDGGGGHQADPGVAVGVVVPVHERAAVLAGVLDRVKPGRERGAVLQRLEVGLRVGVV
jgi:hypothetical protein